MGIIDLETMNKAPLGKWLWNLLKTEGLWQQLLRDKYLSRKILTAQKTKTGASHFWHGLMEIKDTFFSHCLEKNRKWDQHPVLGRQLDLEGGGGPLAQQFPHLYRNTHTVHDSGLGKIKGMGEHDF